MYVLVGSSRIGRGQSWPLRLLRRYIQSKTECVVRLCIVWFFIKKNSISLECYTTFVMRDLVFSTHITMECSNICDQCCKGSKLDCYTYLTTLCAVGISCDWLIMEYTHDKFSGILLFSDACNNWADTVAWVYVTYYLAWCHPYANVFLPRSMQGLMARLQAAVTMADANMLTLVL